MTPAECHPGMLVRLCSAPGRIWEVQSTDGGRAELRHRESGSRCHITVSSLLPVDPAESWQERVWTEALQTEPEPEPARRPPPRRWPGILVVVAFAALHVWAAIRIGRGITGLDPAAAAVAIASSGVGWTLWFVTLLWVQWRRRR